MPDITMFADGPAIEERINTFANIINALYKEKAVTLVGILRGGAPFAVDIAKAIAIPVVMEWMCLRSYTGTSSTGQVQVLLKPAAENIKDRHVILLDDIIDTGLSAHTAIALIKEMHPASVQLITAVDKPEARLDPVPEFQASMWKVTKDNYVVGYGMDFEGKYRDLPFMASYQPGEPGSPDRLLVPKQSLPGERQGIHLVPKRN